MAVQNDHIIAEHLSHEDAGGQL